MPIVSSVIEKIKPMPDGGRFVTIAHTDQIGQVHRVRSHVGPLDDLDVFKTDYANMLNDRLPLREQRNFQQRLEDGEDPTTFQRVHTTARQMLRYILRGFMEMDAGPKAAKVAAWLTANVTATQIETATNTRIKTKIQSRVQRLSTMQGELDADALDREEII
jgi:hypothetical protein